MQMTGGLSWSRLWRDVHLLVDFLGLLCFACRCSILSLACTSKTFLCKSARSSCCMLREYRMQALLTVLLRLNLALRPCFAEVRLVLRPGRSVMLMPEHLMLILSQAWCLRPGQCPAKAECMCTSHCRSL